MRDTVNVRFEGLDIDIRNKMHETLKFIVPHARHTAQFKLGRWDGTVGFCSPTGNTFLNVLDRLLPILEEEHIDIEIDDRRPEYDFCLPPPDATMFAHINWPPGHPQAGEPIILRDYQIEAIRVFIANLQSVQIISTGAGKTLLTAALSQLIEPYGRSIVIVPSKNLVLQTEEDYRNIGLDVGVFYGDRKEWQHKHTICTWHSLSVFDKKSRRADLPISIMQFIKDVTCVIVDEAHTVRGKELKNLMCGPFAQIPIRWGLTGTVPKDEHEAIPLLISIGPVVGELRASELQEKGVLANCHVEITQIQDIDLVFKNYDMERKYLVTDRKRIERIAERISKWSEDGNTLVLVNNVATGVALRDLLQDASFVYGKTKTIERKEEYSSIQTATDKIIIATYGVAAVGINIPRIFNLVLLEAGKSFVRVIQSIGRGLRKTQDKEKVCIYDVCSSLKFSKSHLTKRKEYYREAKYPFTMVKLKL